VSEWAVTNRMGVRCFGIVPDVTGALGPQFRAGLVEAVRGVSVTARLDVRSPNCKLVLVSSSLPDEGKTEFAATLAKGLSDAGQRVLVLDAVPRVEGRVIDMPKVESAAGLVTNRDIAPEPYQAVIFATVARSPPSNHSIAT
jgi:Mrp family chromosome partitioning ATPase